MLEFKAIKQQIVTALRENDVYERDEGVRKILIDQVNTIKDQLKLEMQSRQQADKEIQEALEKYQLIIQEQVVFQRAEIQAAKPQVIDGPVGAAAAPTTDPKK